MSKDRNSLREMAANGRHYTMSYDFYANRWLSSSDPHPEIDRSTGQVTHVVSYKHRPYERTCECVVHGVYESKKDAEDEAERLGKGGAVGAGLCEYDEITDVCVTEHKLKVDDNHTIASSKPPCEPSSWIISLAAFTIKSRHILSLQA